MSIRKTKKRESFATNAKSLADDEENEEDTNKISDIYEDKKEKETEICGSHKRTAEIVCLQCKEMICANCALFGSHKGHNINS